MKLALNVSVNRIYFDQFDTPCGEPEVAELRSAWEHAVITAIWDSGFEADTEFGVGHDSQVKWYLCLNGEVVTYNGDRRSQEAIRGDLHIPFDDCEECDNAMGKELLTAVLPSVLRDAKLTIEAAIDAGYDAAKALSDKFTAASQAVDTE